jgi:hypothetical protein
MRGNMFRKKLPSRILLDYIEGRGRGDEIDHYVHSGVTDLEEQEVVTPLMEISSELVILPLLQRSAISLTN